MNNLAWISLITAGLFEIGWPVGLKMAQMPGKTLLGVVLALACMLLSGFLLFYAQKSIPMGTAYAVWTGIGAAGAFLVGVAFYGDSTNLIRVVGVGLIIAGVIVLKMSHSDSNAAKSSSETVASSMQPNVVTRPDTETPPVQDNDQKHP